MVADAQRRTEAIEAAAERRLEDLERKQAGIRGDLAKLHQQLAALTRAER
jgi:hypothetical protein